MKDSHYRWLIVSYTVIMQAVVIGTLIYCFSLFAVSWLDEFSAPRRDVMLTIALLQIGSGIYSPFIGRALDHYKTRPLVFAGLGSLLLGLVLVSNAQALWQVQLVYALIFPFSVTLSGTLTSQTLVTKWFSDNRGIAIGLSAMGTNIGGIVFPVLVAGWLVATGWRDTLLLLAAVSILLVVPLTWLLLGRAPSKPPQSTASKSIDDRLWSTGEILTTRLFWIPMFSLLPLNLTFSGFVFNLGAFSRDLGLDTETSGQLLAIVSLCMVLGKFFFGGLGDRIDHRRLYWSAASLMFASMLILQLTASYWTLLVAAIGVGLGGGSILPLIGLIYGARFGIASFGRVMGFAMLSISLGSMGPLLAGWIYDLTGQYDQAFLLFGLFFIPAMILIYKLPDPE